MTAVVLLILVPLLPLLLAALVVTPGCARLRHLTPWVALPGLAVALWLPEGAQGVYPGLLLGMELRLDETARVFLVVTSLLWGASGMYALGYLRGDARECRFHLFFLLAMSGNLGLVLAADAVGFYTFFALMSLSSYGLVIHAGGAAVRRAGRIYLIMAAAGEVALFAGLVIHVSAAGGLAFAQLAATPLAPTAAALLVIGFGIKAGLVPLHVWLPLAHPAAPVPASAVLSGAMIKAGLLGWLRLLQLEGPGWPELGTVLAVLGLSGALLAAVAGVMQRRPKTILAYSSISQMGLMICGVGLAMLMPGASDALLGAVLAYMAHHGLAKGALFLGAGVVARRRTRPVLLVLVLPAAALAGLPWTSGALAKQALKSPLYGAVVPWAGMVEWLLAFAAVGTTLLMTRFLWCAWNSEGAHAGEVPLRMALPWLALSSAALLMPVVSSGSAGPAWSLLWPPAVGMLTALAAMRIFSRRPAPLLAEGDLVVPVERAVTAVVQAVRERGLPWRGHREGLTRARFRPVWQGLDYGAARMEAMLSRWESVGVLFMVLVLGIFVSVVL